VLAANPNFAESYNNLGVVINQTGKKKEAHQAFLKTVDTTS
jgi:Flp pilus assembly protein TadD